MAEQKKSQEQEQDLSGANIPQKNNESYGVDAGDDYNKKAAAGSPVPPGELASGKSSEGVEEQARKDQGGE